MDKSVQNPIQTIESLIKYLPQRDIFFGYKYLKERNFDALWYLVDSAIKRINNSPEKEEYRGINMDFLVDLWNAVDNYCTLLDLDP